MEVLQTNGVKAAAEAGASSFMVDDDDLLNFSLDDGVDSQSIDGFSKAPSFSSSIPLLDDFSRPPTFPGFVVEEELEWLSNKDAFPSVETCFDLLTENLDMNVLNHHSPVSVLENSNSSSCSASNGSGIANGSTTMSFYGSLQVPTGFPVRARSKRRLRCRSGLTEFTQQLLWWKQANSRNDRFERRHVVKGNSNAGRSCLHCHADETPQWRAGPMGPRTLCNACGVRYVVKASKSRSNVCRRCLHCQADETPQWRAGPMGPKTLCNACGVRYKSGRLVPEYRPANSPTFSAAKHSNSHRKIVEMRKQKQTPMGGGFTGVVSGGFTGVVSEGFMGSESRTDSGEHGFGIGI